MTRSLSTLAFVLALVCAGPRAGAQTCLTTGDMDLATRNAVESAARQYFGYAATGDAASLRSYAIPSLAGNFGGIERAVAENRDAFAGQQPSVHSTYLLDASGGPATLENATFLCGVFNSENSLAFSIPNLPAGRYALIILEASGQRGSYWLSLVLQQLNGSWRLAGFYPKQRRVGDKGPGWFLTQARGYRAKGQLRNAYFYYLTARDLALPVAFMMTRPVEKLDSEALPIVPRDLPGQTPLGLVTASGRLYQITDIRPAPVGGALDLVIKYKALSDIKDTRTSYANNLELLAAFAAKYPEYRGAFAGLVARAVDPATGNDYGTMKAMEEIQ
jgi:hypothetical protein